VSRERWLLGATSDSHGLDELEAQGRMTWIEARHGWAAAPDDVVEALSRDDFSSLERDPYTDDGGES
jgi:hypothetical protein